MAEFLGRTSPAGLQKIIRENNERVFNIFVSAEKPIIAAVNGPSIGGGTTSPALCDTIIASKKATFSTPFAKLGVKPEGCASIHFERMMGEEAARRMLVDGFKPTAQEALEIGLVEEVVDHDQLQARAQELGEEWVKQGRERKIRGGGSVEEYKKVNTKESEDLTVAFVSKEFLENQYNFLQMKGKHRSGAGLFLWVMIKTRPLWIRSLTKPK